MPLFSSHDPKSKHHQAQATAATEKPAFQTMSNNQSQPESHGATAMHMTFPAHKNTPCTLYAGGAVD